MADQPDDLANPFPSPRLVEIPLNEYQGYYCTRHGRLFPRHRLPPHLRDEPDVQHPSVLPADPAEMEVRVDDDHPSTPIYRVLLFLATRGPA